ncbi:ACT domain-containing protein [uncultured Mailhella sp.]|uniref:ACT domain-containing protein n=1 Tax=uncultured Mailhella sp. TaxID=1981031 RepID=UPI002635794D|nr:ACT domain-containing protein [uncultured Mailhella sp.]
MTTVEQISVFVENRAGQLGDVTRILYEAGVNIRALSLSDTTDFGVLRLVADDIAKAREALQDAGFTVGTTPVVAVEVSDRPGGLGGILALLSEHGINVEYLYAYTQRESSKATLIFRFDRNKDAIAVLREQGVRVLGPEELGD